MSGQAGMGGKTGPVSALALLGRDSRAQCAGRFCHSGVCVNRFFASAPAFMHLPLTSIDPAVNHLDL